MSKPQTLLEKARSAPRRNHKPVNDEELDLSIALLNGDIQISQATHAAGIAPNCSHIVYRAYICIRDAIAAGKIPRIERIGAKNGKGKP